MRKDKRYEAKYYDPQSGQRRSTYSRTSQEDANAQARKLGRRKGDDSYGWYYLNAYLPTIAMRKFSWRQQVAWAHDKHILPEFDYTPLNEMTREKLQRFYNQLATKIGKTSVSHVRKIMGQVMRLAEDDGLILKNPCPRVRIQTPDPKEPYTFSPEELWKLYECSHDLIKPLVFLCGFMGLRQGEALGLRWSHVEGNIVRVSEQLQLQGKELVTVTPKTKSGIRAVPLPKGMLAEIDSFRGALYVCKDSQGGVLRPKNVRRELNIAQRAAKLPETGPHALRHSFITGLRVELECPDHIVKNLIGHAGDETIDRYTRKRIARMEHWMGVWWERVSTGLTTTEMSSKQAK